jgi:hypothetical protein
VVSDPQRHSGDSDEEDEPDDPDDNRHGYEPDAVTRPGLGGRPGIGAIQPATWTTSDDDRSDRRDDEDDREPARQVCAGEAEHEEDSDDTEGDGHQRRCVRSAV